MLKRALSVAVPFVLMVACSNNHGGAGLVPEAGVVATPAGDAGAAAAPTADLSQCAGCTVTPAISWTFQGIFKDDKCTIPLAQADTPACAPVPAVGPASVTFVDRHGAHAANATANITLTEQVAPDVARFRKTGDGCARANEVATDVTPMNCAGQRVCRDAAGTLACANCRTFANGCADFEQTRTYAAIQDTPTAGVPTNGNLERLKQCCNALATQGKSLGASPEGLTMISASQQCLAIVAQAGPKGTAPELGPIRGYLQGANVPAVCKGL
jgi:hypothetical protein